MKVVVLYFVSDSHDVMTHSYFVRLVLLKLTQQLWSIVIDILTQSKCKIVCPSAWPMSVSLKFLLRGKGRLGSWFWEGPEWLHLKVYEMFADPTFTTCRSRIGKNSESSCPCHGPATHQWAHWMIVYIPIMWSNKKVFTFIWSIVLLLLCESLDCHHCFKVPQDMRVLK